MGLVSLITCHDHKSLYLIWKSYCCRNSGLQSQLILPLHLASPLCSEGTQCRLLRCCGYRIIKGKACDIDGQIWATSFLAMLHHESEKLCIVFTRGSRLTSAQQGSTRGTRGAFFPVIYIACSHTVTRLSGADGPSRAFAR